jgi:hypothetical protein
MTDQIMIIPQNNKGILSTQYNFLNLLRRIDISSPVADDINK